MSAAAQAVLVEIPAFLEAPPSSNAAEEVVRNLVHDLRQPLSSIEAIAYYLEMTLPAEQVQARMYMRRLQQLVDQADATLECAVSGIRKRELSAL